MRIIVAWTHFRGAQRARNEGLPLSGPQRVMVISTDTTDGSAGRGMRLNRDQVIWDDEWWQGRHADAVEAALAPCFKE